MEALRRGDALKARESFERLVAEGRADGNVCVALARACGELGDIPAVHAALDRALALNPLDFRALILKGDRFAEAADAPEDAVGALGRQAAVVAGDIGDLDGQEALVAAAWDRFGGIDCLVNNAGV